MSTALRVQSARSCSAACSSGETVLDSSRFSNVDDIGIAGCVRVVQAECPMPAFLSDRVNGLVRGNGVQPGTYLPLSVVQFAFFVQTQKRRLEYVVRECPVPQVSEQVVVNRLLVAVNQRLERSHIPLVTVFKQQLLVTRSALASSVYESSIAIAPHF